MSSRDQDLTLQQRTDRLLAREAAVQYTHPEAKVSISEPKPEPAQEVKMAKDESKVPEFDTDKVEQLLNIVADLRDTAALANIRASAQMQLAAIDKELWEELYPEQAEAERKRLEAIEEEEERRKAEEKEKAA